MATSSNERPYRRLINRLQGALTDHYICIPLHQKNSHLKLFLGVEYYPYHVCQIFLLRSTIEYRGAEEIPFYIVELDLKQVKYS